MAQISEYTRSLLNAVDTEASNLIDTIGDEDLEELEGFTELIETLNQLQSNITDIQEKQGWI